MVEIVFILDRSGSMGGLEQDTIGGFNSMLAKQRTEAGDALISTVLFDHECEVVHDRLPIQEVPEMDENTYYVRGCTALLDAVGGAIHHIGNIHKYARKEDIPERTLFIITTDGMENASKHYNYQKVREMIEQRKKQHGWEFLFLGANMDAVSEAQRFGIDASNAVTYQCDSVGTAVQFAAVSNAVSHFRHSKSIAPDWQASIAKDMEERGTKKVPQPKNGGSMGR